MTETLDVLLIEDNPGDARLIEEMLREGEELIQRVDPGGSTGGNPTIHHDQRLSDGLEFLDQADVDVLLLDLNLPDSRGLETLETVVETTGRMPIVVLTGLDDHDLGVQAIQQGAQDYLVKDQVTADLLVRTIHHAIERERRREQLESLNRLNRIVQDVTHLIINSMSREDLEREICTRLADPDSYRFAWIGEVERGGDQVIPREAAGIEMEALNTISITIDDQETAQGPTGQAVQTHEVQVVEDIETDPDYEPWRDRARKYGYRSSAAVPIVYEGVRYGVLNVYAASRNAFSDPEIEILGRLGDVVGHAIAAIERKDALVSDAVLELEFRVEGFVDDLITFSTKHSGEIRVENLISPGEEVLAYGTAADVPREGFRDVVHGTDAVDDYRLFPGESDQFEFELVVDSVRPLFEAVAAHGGRVASATIADDEFRIVVTFPQGNDTRRMIGLVEEHCSNASLVAQRTTQRPSDAELDPRSVLDDLTEKQRDAIRTAYIAGYFDWPRTSDGGEVAERLGITSATFTQHLRAAERKFFEAVFDGPAEGDDE